MNLNFWLKRPASVMRAVGIALAVGVIYLLAVSDLFAQSALDLDERHLRVKTLIKMLASANSMPQTKKLSFGNDYDPDKQAPVILAALQLLREDTVAIKALAEVDENDKRYSLSIISEYGLSHLTVGEVATVVMYRMINVGDEHPYSWLIPNEAGGVQEIRQWLKKQERDSSLHYLQLSSIEERKQLLQSRVYSKGIRRHPLLDSDLSDEQFEKGRKQVLDNLDGLKAQLSQSKRPLEVRTLDVFRRHVWGLPWNSKEPPF